MNPPCMLAETANLWKCFSEMRVGTRVRHSASLAVWLLVLFPALMDKSHAQGFRPESAGARYGFPSGDTDQKFRQGEAFMDWDLPWNWDLGPTWRLETRLDFALGWLGRDSQNSVIGSAGPLLAFGNRRFPVWLECGVSATGLSRTEFGPEDASGSKDFGDPFQFTDHIGVYCNLPLHLRIEYRFQHMSNAGLFRPDPGLNLNVVSLSYRF